MQTIREALGIAYQPCGARVFADADEQALARGPGTRDGTRLHLVEKLLVDALGRAPERELAESGEIGRREEVLERALGLLRDVDLSLFQALDQVVGGEVDELDGVGAIEDRVRYGLPHADTGDLRHHVVQALDVLNVERGVDVDAFAQQLFDVEIALGVPAAGGIGMGELVDERQVRAARDQAVEIHLLERVILVRDGAARKDLKAVEQRLGLFAAMRLDHADDDVRAILHPGPGLLQHLVGLAHARSGAQEDLQPSSAALFLLCLGKQCLGRGALI